MEIHYVDEPIKEVSIDSGHRYEVGEVEYRERKWDSNELKNNRKFGMDREKKRI